MTCIYTQLFLGAKFYAPDDDGGFEAARDLSGKETDGSNTVSVLDAVSSGTKDLSDNHKLELFTHCSGWLVGGGVDYLRRLADAEDEDRDNFEEDWTLVSPFRDFFTR
mgnify:CR=1 FL=1